MKNLVSPACNEPTNHDGLKLTEWQVMTRIYHPIKCYQIYRKKEGYMALITNNIPTS